MKKIAIVGSGGSGKSTFSRLLSNKLNLPVYHLDSLYWLPNWQKRPTQAWLAIQKGLCLEESWIMDGNYVSSLDIRLERCDTVIFLDVNRFTCIFRAIKRALTSQHRPDMAEGCEERLDWEFIKYLWNYPKHIKPRVLNKLYSVSATHNIIIAKSGRHALKLLRS